MVSDRVRVLIGFVGKGKYEEVVYTFGDGSGVRTSFTVDALRRRLCPEELYLFGTEESIWEVAEKTLGGSSYKKVTIPFGSREEELWEILKKILEEVEFEGKEVHIDITHAFRSIPIFVFTVVNLVSKVKNAKVEGVYYGMFEARKDDRVPVVNLMPIVRLNDFVDSFVAFKNYGDGSVVAELIRETKPRGDLNRLANMLDSFSKAVGFTALEFIGKKARSVADILSRIESFPKELHALELLRDAFLETSRTLTEEGPLWKRHMKVVRWLFEKRRYSQALIALEEVVITGVMESVGIDDLYNEKVRMRMSEILDEDKDKHTLFSKDLNSLFSKIKDLRNKTGHAFMRKEVGDKDIRRGEERLKKFIEEAEEVLEEGSYVRDLEEVRLRINQYGTRLEGEAHSPRT